jgi:flagellar protein FlbD
MAVIPVTRLDGTPVLINADQIESIEQTPDTIVCFTSGHKLLVRDLPADLATRIREYKRAVLAARAELDRDTDASDDSAKAARS